MNTNEKKALFSFLSIYVGSALLLIGILLYVYYQDEIKSIQSTCSMELKNSSMQIKNDILNAHMHHKDFVPEKINDENISYALFDKNKHSLFSYIDNESDISFDKSFYELGKYHFFIEKLNEDDINIKYIVTKTPEGVRSKENLIIYTVVVFLFSAIFVCMIAFFLAKLLLKPVREQVKQLDNFIKDSAHELNTPISVLMTSVTMLKNGKNSEKMMKYILSSSKQISQIYNDIHFSAFDDINENHVEEFRLDELVHDSVEYFNDISITKRIIIKAKVEEIFILMDRTKTQKIVNNLISNAIKYSKSDSEILVELKDSIFSVQDFGIGISKKDQKKIFERYKRGLNTEGGFGIGLDIVKRICHDYKLKLDFTSKINEGSTFFVDFKNVTLDPQ